MAVAAQFAEKELDGFDPLEGETRLPNNDDPNKPVILNVLNSYTGFFDLFSELIQNALDATQLRQRQDPSYRPRIWIEIDIKDRRVKVTDNGVGMDIEQFKFCFRPNVTFKRGTGLRGNKGVGATYLAYGFAMIRIQSKREDRVLAAVLRGGRRWTEDASGSVPRPKLESEVFCTPELERERSGASFEVILGSSQGERPRDLGWIGARTAKQWFNVLRIKTPLGGVSLTTSKFHPTVSIRVIDVDSTFTDHESTACEYYYPHEFPNKVAALSDIKSALERIPGDANTKFSKLSNDLKKLDCMYEVWVKDQLLQDGSDFGGVLDQDEQVLVERHNVAVYAAFLSSSKEWSNFNDEVLGLRRGQRIMSGGLQIACDGMIQGDALVIPLTSTIGYQANAHVVIHLMDGNPDMGRKVFQPEVKRLAEKLAVRAVTIFKRYLQHRRPEAGPPNISASKALHEWKKAQEAHRDKRPLAFQYNGQRLALNSEPQQEQDVVALFHELIGIGLLKGYQIFATSQSETYDSLYELNYPDDTSYRYEKHSRPLAVADRYLNQSTEPKILEYKYDFDGLLDDIEQEVKSQSHIDLVVCWTASKRYKDRYFFKSLLVDDEGSERFHFGATHQAFPESTTEMAFEVIILKDLLSYIGDRASEEARQKQFYKDD